MVCAVHSARRKKQQPPSLIDKKCLVPEVVHLWRASPQSATRFMNPGPESLFAFLAKFDGLSLAGTLREAVGIANGWKGGPV